MTLPNEVNSTPCPAREVRSTPSALSISAIRLEMAGCVTLNARATALTCFRSARETKIRRCCSFSPEAKDRKSVVAGRRGTVLVDHGGGRIIKKKKIIQNELK